MCNKILFILWWVAFICGLCLILLCIVFGNSPPDSIYHELVLYFGTIGAVLVFLACLFKPMVRELIIEDVRNFQSQELLVNNHEPKMIITDNIVIIEPYIDNNDQTNKEPV